MEKVETGQLVGGGVDGLQAPLNLGGVGLQEVQGAVDGGQVHVNVARLPGQANQTGTQSPHHVRKAAGQQWLNQRQNAGLNLAVALQQ